MRARKALCLVFVVVSFLPTFGDAPSAEPLPLVEKGLAAIDGQLYDSALVYFLGAHKQGMARDSLFLLLAEVYLSRGIPDTALGLNLGIHAEPGSDLKRAVLRQRYMIYTRLGFADRAHATLDSLKRNRGRSEKDFMPSLSLAGALSYDWEELIEEVEYPWQLPESPQRTDTAAGPEYSAKAEIFWSIPLVDRSLLRVGANARLARPNTVRGPLHSLDSVGLDAGFSVRVSDIVGGLFAEYRWTRKIAYYDKRTSVNAVSLGYAHSAAAFMLYSSTGLALELGERFEQESHSGHFLAYVATARARPALDLLILLNYHTSDPLVYNDTTYVHSVVTLQQNPLSGEYYPVPYATVSHDASVRQPQQFVSVNATPSVTFELPFGLRLVGGPRWMLTYYPSVSSWSHSGEIVEQIDTIRINLVEPGGNKYVIERDGEYYWLDESAAGTLLVRGPIERIEKNRLDNAIYLNLSLRRTFSSAGTFSVSGMISKTRSTLSADAPIDIPGWNWNVGASWQKDFTWE